MKRIQSLIFSILTTAACISQAGELADLSRQIDHLIRQLDDDSFPKRQDATKQLVEIGEPVIKELTRSLQSDSPEVRYRAREIIDTIRRPVFYTISFDGHLFQLKVGKRGFEKQLVARLGKPFDEDDIVVEGLDISPADGQLYAAVTFPRDGGRNSKLFRIDPAGKAVQLIGELAPTEIDGLAFDKRGALFGMTSSSRVAKNVSLGQLLRINPATAEVRTVNNGLNYGDLDAFAISAKGTAVICSGKTVSRTRFDGDFGISTKLTRHPVCGLIKQVGDIEGMAFDGASAIYGICHRKTSGHLIRFDIDDNSCVYLGDLGFPALNLAKKITLRKTE